MIRNSHHVTVAKALLAPDESVCEATSKLREALAKELVYTDDDYIYLEAVYDDHVIVWRYREVLGNSEYLRFDFTRNGDEFTLSDPMRVEPKITYEPYSE